MLDSQFALTDPALLGAEQAWTQSTGRGALVAVLDTGAQLDHPDLRGSLWTNPGEIAGNGADDDANGVVDDVHGANVLNGTGDVADDHGHGTHVAGMIAAAANNGTGGSGVAPEAKLMVVKVLDGGAAGGGPAVAAGIRYALASGARILNLPLNSDQHSPAVEMAVAEAGAAGATVVTSAGNNRRDVDGTPSYPASLPGDHVLGVAATGPDGDLWRASNYGTRAVELAAPGEHILSTARGAGYEERSGTSMASSYVAGALALLAAARPELAQAQLRRALLEGARRPPGLRGLVGRGQLSIVGAMRRLLPGAAWRDPVRLHTPTGMRDGRVTLSFSAAPLPSVQRWRVSVDGKTVARLSRGAPLRVRTRVAPGAHRWRVVALTASRHRVVGDGGRFHARRAG